MRYLDSCREIAYLQFFVFSTPIGTGHVISCVFFDVDCIQEGQTVLETAIECKIYDIARLIEVLHANTR